MAMDIVVGRNYDIGNIKMDESIADPNNDFIIHDERDGESYSFTIPKKLKDYISIYVGKK